MSNVFTIFIGTFLALILFGLIAEWRLKERGGVAGLLFPRQNDAPDGGFLEQLGRIFRTPERGVQI